MKTDVSGRSNGQFVRKDIWSLGAQIARNFPGFGQNSLGFAYFSLDLPYRDLAKIAAVSLI